MAKRKEDTKPLFDLKHDFYASLDNALSESINLLGAVDTIVQMGLLTGAANDQLKARAEALRSALMSAD